MYDGHLNVIIPINLSYIKPHIDNVNEILGTIRFLCNQQELFDNLECQNMLQPCTAQYRDIINNFDSISHLTSKRQKRSAWFSGIGTVFKHIIGTLDENDAIKYDEAVETIQRDQTKLATLMKQNILVTTSTLSTYNKIIHEVRINEAILSNSIEQLSLNFKNISETVHKLDLQVKMNEILSVLEGTLMALSFKLEDISNSLLFSKNNVLHPSVLTPYQLYKELADNYRYIPNSKQLPVILDIDNINALINVSDIITFFLNDTLMYILKIPLVTSTEYDVFRCIPLPLPYNKTNLKSYTTIIPSTKYIAITKDKTLYCNIDSIKKCKTMGKHSFICDVMNVFPTNANPSCESEIMTQVVNSLPKQCTTKFIYGHINAWHPLENNRWIYVQSHISKLSIDCVNSELYDINISGTGILKLPYHCKAYCNTAYLYPKSTTNIKINVIHSNFNLINDSCCNYSKFNISVPNVLPAPLLINNLDDLKNSNIDSNVANLIKDLDKLIVKPHIIKYGTHYSISIIVLSIILILIILFLVRKNKYKLLSYFLPKSTPKPEPNSEEDHDETVIPMPRLRSNL